MSDLAAVLGKKPFILIFAYAPVGFGHLRVSDALYHGLPQAITPVLLGSQDQSISNIYRFVSIHPATRALMEWSQSGIGENIFTYFYKTYLRSHGELLYQQLTTILDQRIDIPETIIVVATHFGLAHQLSAIKKRLEREKNIKIVLIVQITDDSPQKLWYVPDADIIFSPSHQTVSKLQQYAKQAKLAPVKFIVNPYPISPLFVSLLSHDEHKKRIEQLDPESHSLIHFVVPISGAAVGMSFYSSIISILTKASNRFKFHVIAKSAPYTQTFLQTILPWTSVDLHVSVADREVVNMYEQAYLNEIISLEITKPSEQAFKALINPRRRGGSLMFFSEPVGRQEFDNLAFLQRHKLIPQSSELHKLWEKADKGINVLQSDELYLNALNWRALILPNNPNKASQFILWALKSHLLLQMVHKKDETNNFSELSPHGVHYFWNSISEYLQGVNNK